MCLPVPSKLYSVAQKARYTLFVKSVGDYHMNWPDIIFHVLAHSTNKGSGFCTGPQLAWGYNK